MSPREEKRQRSKIRNALLTDENMVRALDDLFGPGIMPTIRKATSG